MCLDIVGEEDWRVVCEGVVRELVCVVFFLVIRRPPRSTQSRSSAASDVYKRQVLAVKDRVLGHNPLAALYLTKGPYYSRLNAPAQPGEDRPKVTLD